MLLNKLSLTLYLIKHMNVILLLIQNSRKIQLHFESLQNIPTFFFSMIAVVIPRLRITFLVTQTLILY